MKKIFFVIFAVFMVFNLFAQQIPKNYVVIETCTEDGCPYCPYAQRGLDYMVNNHDDVIPVHYHYSSVVGNSYGDYRMLSFYNISGFPTSFFNGHVDVIGGWSGTNSDYEDAYNQVKDELTSFKCNIVEVVNPDDENITVKVRVEKVADYTGTNVKLITVVTENSAPHNWEGFDHVNYLQRTMVPNAYGTAVNLPNIGDVDTITLNFSIDHSWNIDSLNFVAFLQDMNSKEILQADRHTLALPYGNNNVRFLSFLYPADTVFWSDRIAATILVKNKGANELTSFEIEYWVNDGEHHTQQWTGSIPSLATGEINLDTISFTLLENDTLFVFLANPNDSVDEFAADNSGLFAFTRAKTTGTPLYLDMNTGAWGFEISYLLEMLPDGDTVKYFKSPSGPLLVKDTFNLELNKCYKFHLFDSYGNGFNSDDGYCRVYTPQGEDLFYVSGDFGHEFWYAFEVTEYLGVKSFKSLLLYPNPAQNELNISGNYGDVYARIFDITGKLLVNRTIPGNGKIDISHLKSGVYLIKIFSARENKLLFEDKFVKQ